LTTTDI